MLILACAVGFLLWVHGVRIERVAHVSSQPSWSVDVPVPDSSSSTGYAAGVRRHLVPGQNGPSYEWIAQTQQMLATQDWRVRRVAYDNAPFGREVHSAFPYRWWLGMVAMSVHVCSATPIGVSVERAALLADPLLHLLLLISATLFVRFQLGRSAAVITAVGLAGLFPFAAGFVAGAPSALALALALGLWSVLLLLPALLPLAPGEPGGRTDPVATAAQLAGAQATRWFLCAGLVAGAGFWIEPAAVAPLIAGIATGGVLAGLIRSGPPPPLLPWRAWAAGGAAMTLIAYLAEYFPSDMDPTRFDAVHPIYGLAWLAAGELLAAAAVFAGRRGSAEWSVRRTVAVTLGVAVLISTVIAVHLHGSSFWGSDPLSSQLSGMPGSIAAPSLAAWLRRDGLSAVMLAACLPLLAVVPAAGALFLRSLSPVTRRALAVIAGSVLVTFAAACVELRGFMILDAVLLVLAALLSSPALTVSRTTRGVAAALALAALAPGIARLLPPGDRSQPVELTEMEVHAVIQRDLAHWLALRSSPPQRVAFASPDLTTSLFFHGGLRGIGTLRWENKEGFFAATRIASATSADEALTLLQGRAVNFIVLTSWDSFTDDYATLGLKAARGSSLHEKSFVASLRRWDVPRWLRPVPYSLPEIPGYEGQSVSVFEVVDEQEEPLATSRLAEYFVETGRLDLAAAASERLSRYAANSGALVARAQVARARGEAGALDQTVEALLRSLARGGDRRLPWDRRVNLAIVLAQGKHLDPARAQLQRCLADLTEPRVRTLTTGSLFRLQALCRLFGLEISDPQLRDLARRLLPPELRQRLDG